MEAEIRKTPRGSERMSEFENRLASDVEKRVMAENKMAKTESALIESHTTGGHAQDAQTKQLALVPLRDAIPSSSYQVACIDESGNARIIICS